MKKLPALPSQLMSNIGQLSPSTADQYRRRLARFHQRTGCRLSAITRKSVQDYLAYLARDCHVSASYQNVALSALRWAVRATGQKTDLTGLTARRSERVPTIISHTSALAVLGNMTGQSGMIASLVYGAGLSLTEALELNRSNLRWPKLVIVIGDRSLPIPLSLNSKMNGYDLLAGDDGYLFSVNPNSVSRDIKRAVQAVGLTQTIGTRELRNSYAARLLEQGATIVEVKRLMGYRRLGTLLKIQSQIKTRSA